MDPTTMDNYKALIKICLRNLREPRAQTHEASKSERIYNPQILQENSTNRA